MQVVDIQAFSVMFAARSIPDSWSRIYRGILSGNINGGTIPRRTPIESA